MASIRDLTYAAVRRGWGVTFEEDMYGRRLCVRCTACGQEIGDVPQDMLMDHRTDLVYGFLKEAVDEALERHACPVKIMELAKQTHYTAAQIAAGVEVAMQQTGGSATRALRSFEDSIERLNAVAQVPVPCMRCGGVAMRGNPLCRDCSIEEKKISKQNRKEEAARKLKEAKTSELRVIRFEES